MGPAGPAEHALSERIISELARRVSPLDSQVILLQPAKPALGDFRFDLTPFLGEGALTKEACRKFAASIEDLDFIEKATAIPPRLYIRATTKFLREKVLHSILSEGSAYGSSHEGAGSKTIVTFSDPNANKPLHLGHLRNNFLGMSLSRLLENAGYLVERHGTLSDWGIHICRSLVAYMKWGEGRTPQLEGIKGDHYMGGFYVLFHERSNDDPGLEAEAVEILKKIVSGDEELIRLVETVTRWAESGIDATYQRIGSHFDTIFRERDYLGVALRAIEQALQTGSCRNRPDGSIYVDLSDIGLGETTLVRGDGSTTVYTQILGIDIARFERPIDKVLSIFGQEWEAGAEAYAEVAKKFGLPWIDRYEPVFYGMITLPDGRMRSRDGTVIAADELLDDIRQQMESSKGSSEFQETGVLGLLKYYLLRVPRKNTLPYSEDHLWQNAFPRFSSIIRLLRSVENHLGDEQPTIYNAQNPSELRALLLQLNAFPRAASRALEDREPAQIVRYLDGLCVKAESIARVATPNSDLAKAVEITVRRALDLLNITPPAVAHVSQAI